MATNHYKMTPQELGGWGEAFTYSALTLQGFRVSWASRSEGDHHDINAVNKATGEVYKIEVKTARKDSRDYWQASLARRRPMTVTMCQWLFVLLVDETRLLRALLIPVSEVEGMVKLTISDLESRKCNSWFKYQVKPNSIFGSVTNGE